MPSQRGRTILVTGTGGLGFETGLALAGADGEVILLGRNPEKGMEAVQRIRAATPRASVRFEQADLANLASIKACAERLHQRYERIDTLINNAGVMTPPRRKTTKDGFELQFGTNFLGHFALTAHLLPMLVKGPSPRVVTLSSIAARIGARINFDDLQAEHDYKPMPVYAQSKLACLMFAFELQRRSDAAGWALRSIAAHPGVSRTNLLHNEPGRHSVQGFLRSFLWFLFQPAAQGALPTLYAATMPDATPGGYYGPRGFQELRGAPHRAAVPDEALRLEVARRLWDVSEEITDVRFPAMEKQDRILEEGQLIHSTEI
ncbi:short-chain dehydrogenase [Ensifer adhaerens]|uniref:Short-chain dehydrogenase n=2 Tax=Ensifer adhaerens TaxID=106592 RepID=A0A0L8BF29_ENSAD|nr:short-chain dehydrogenase [Ensifer adhaerens]